MMRREFPSRSTMREKRRDHERLAKLSCEQAEAEQAAFAIRMKAQRSNVVSPDSVRDYAAQCWAARHQLAGEIDRLRREPFAVPGQRLQLVAALFALEEGGGESRTRERLAALLDGAAHCDRETARFFLAEIVRVLRQSPKITAAVARRRVEELAERSSRWADRKRLTVWLALYWILAEVDIAAPTSPVAVDAELAAEAAKLSKLCLGR